MNVGRIIPINLLQMTAVQRIALVNAMGEVFMTDAELNEAVARKLGWVQCCNPRTMENGKIVDCFGWSKGGSHFHEPYPDYSHSIEAAWEIVEWLKANGGDMLWKPYFELGASGNGWTCRVRMNPHEHSDTAPMAICKAFLKLK